MIAGARRKGFDKEPEAGRKKPTILDLLGRFRSRAVPQRSARSLCRHPDSDRRRHQRPVGSERCNHFLPEIYYRATGKVLKTRDRDEFTAHLRALAVFEGQKLPVFERVGGDAETVSHDLGRTTAPGSRSPRRAIRSP
jgi:hypothetical protein